MESSYCQWEKTRDFVKGLVSDGLINIEGIDERDKNELFSTLLSEDDDFYLDIMLDKQVKFLILGLVEDGIDYSIAIQQVIIRAAMSAYHPIIEHIIEEARDEYLVEDFNSRKMYEQIAKSRLNNLTE